MEAKRQKKFMKGLQAIMKMQLRIVRAKEFQELVDSAQISVDNEIDAPERKKKRIQKQTTIGQAQGHMTKNYPDPHMTYKTEKICHNCGIRGHVLKECPKPKIVCYQCGESGHMKNNCLKPQLTHGSQQE